jgi:hypothetical protein
MKVFELFITVIGGLTFLLCLSFLLSWPVYMLWNGCLVGAIVGVNEVTWLQAWGLNILFGILFSAGSSRKKD